ncbi:MAG: hypothetical protein Tsb009_02120 [Planctomycetaceae bacterium]
MKYFLQVFAGDFTAKVLLGLAGLALIRFMPTGEYALLTLATVLSAFVVQGVTGNLNRVYLVGRKQLRLEDTPQRFLSMQVWLLIFLAIAGIPIVHASDDLASVYYLVIAITLAQCLLEFVKTVYQQELKFASFSLIEVARTILFVAALAGLIFWNGNTLKAWQVLVLQAVCVGGVVLVVFGRQIDWTSFLQFGDAWRLSRAVFTSRYLLMIGYFLGVAMLVRIDVFMLGILSNEHQLATFGASFRYYNILMMLLGALHTVFLPLMQKVRTRDELRKLFGQHRRMIVMIVPLILFGAWISEWIIPFIDGGKYPGAVDVFRVLSLSALISLTCSPHANLLLRYGEFRFLFIICAVATIANVGMNAVLIPRWQATGAAWATLIAAGGVNVLIYFRSGKLLSGRSLPTHETETESSISDEPSRSTTDEACEDAFSETNSPTDRRSAA